MIKNIKFRKYSVIDGLSQNIVYSVNQDRKGFIWICTQQGLNRFDGKEFVIYKNDPQDKNSIANDLVYSSYNSADGKLWFGSIDGNFFCYNPEYNNFVNYKIPLRKNKTDSKFFVFDFAEDKSGTLYIASFGEGVLRFLPDKKIFTGRLNSKYFKDKLKNTTKILSDNDTIWIGTWENGLFRYDINSDTFENYCEENNPANSISNNRIRFIYKDSRNDLWIGTSNGLNIYDSEKRIFINPLSDTKLDLSASGNTFTCISEDKNGNMWIGTKSSGLIFYDVKENSFTLLSSNQHDPDSISDNSVISLFNDRSNVLWAGTFNDGLNKTDCDRKKFYTLRNITERGNVNSKLSVSAITKDNSGNIYLGTLLEGLFIKRKNSNQLEIFSVKDGDNLLLKGHTITCIYKDKINNIYFGVLGKGFYSYNSQTGETENYGYPDAGSENTVFSIAEFDENNLWLGTRLYGLLLFDKVKKTYRKYYELKKFRNNISNHEIKVIIKDRSGILWIGSDAGGLSRLDFEKGEIKQYVNNPDDRSSVSENYIISICEDINGNLWTGTMNRGLNLFIKETDTFRRFNMNDGLPDNTIRAIVCDGKGFLWISTNNGISKFDTVNFTFRNYEYGDGLQSKEFNDRASFVSEDGTIYFGGVRGISFFHPDEIKDNTHIPEIALTDFKIFNQSIQSFPQNPYMRKYISEAGEIELSYRESVISFEFASLVFNNISKNQYAYKMEGFDKEWTYCGTRRFVTYTSLEPGVYRFVVKGTNNDGLWNEAGASVKISITPPYWKTIWFKSFGILSLIGLTGIAYTQKVNKINREKKSQEEFSKRLLESQEHERKNIATELHHTIAHGILITKNKAEIAMNKISEPEKMQKAFKEISEFTSSTLNDLRSITNNLHPHQLERLGLTKAIKSIINHVEKSTELKISAYIDNADNTFAPDQEINIYRIVQECLNNIMKHSHADETYISISKKENNLDLLISDNGIGMPKNYVKGIGMTELFERVKLYDGSISIESHHGQGTKLRISFPLKTKL